MGDSTSSYLPAFVCFPIISKAISDPLVDLTEGHFLFGVLGAKYLVFSPLVPSKQEKNILVVLSLHFF